MKIPLAFLTTTLDELSNHYDAFLLDAYGVFWSSNQLGAYPFAKEAMQKLVSRGKHVGILSNSSQLAEKEKEKLERHSIYLNIHYHFLYSSGQVTWESLQSRNLPFKTPRYTYWQWGEDHPNYASAEKLFEGSLYKKTKKIEDADFIYIHIPHLEGVDQIDPKVFESSVKKASFSQLPVLCANPDHFAHEGNPKKLVVRQGLIAQLFEKYGAKVYYVGKPYLTAYQVALNSFPADLKKDKILMVGDTLETDIWGAKNAGIKSALVTETGIFHERYKDCDQSSFLNSLAKDKQPDYLIKRLELNDV